MFEIMAGPRCTTCSAGLTVTELRGTECPYCHAKFPEDLDAIEPPPGAPPPPKGPPGQYAPPIYPTPYAAFNVASLAPPSSSSSSSAERGGLVLVLVALLAALVAIGAGAYFLIR